MKSSKLFKYLSVLQPSDWREMLQYFKGSIGEFNDAYKLFSNVYSYRKNLTHKKLEIDYMNEALFPHLSRKSFQNIMSVLIKEIETFWIWKDLKEQKARIELHRLEALNRRGLYLESSKTMKALEKRADNDLSPDLWNDYYVTKGRFEILFSYHPVKQKTKELKEMFSDYMSSLSSFVANIFEYSKTELLNLEKLKSHDWNKEIGMINSLVLEVSPTMLSKSLAWQHDLVKSDYQIKPQQLSQFIRNKKIEISKVLHITYYYRVRRYLLLRARTGEDLYIDELLSLISWSSKVELEV